MDVVFQSTLKKWVKKHGDNRDLEVRLFAWLVHIKGQKVTKPSDIKKTLGSPDIIHTTKEAEMPEHLLRVVWNIGRDFRLVTHVDVLSNSVFLKGLHSHKEYDRLNLNKHKYD